jgi:hypothetical protein
MKRFGIWFGRRCFRVGYCGPGLAWERREDWPFSVRHGDRGVKVGDWALIYLPPIKMGRTETDG